MTFDEIEDCFPDGALSDNETGKTLVSAQWLHDFARNIAALEREACAKECEYQEENGWEENPEYGSWGEFNDAAAAIRSRLD